MQYSELREQVTAAMRAKDKNRLSILRQVLGEVDAHVIDNRLDAASDEDVANAIRKTLKQTSETYEASVKAGTNQERTDTLAEQIAVLEELLPPQLSGSKLEETVRSVIAENGFGSMRDMGSIISIISEMTGGNFDKSAVAGFAKAAFAG